MTITSVIIWTFIAYLTYKFITGFVIPVVNTTRKVKSQFNAMKEKMEEFTGKQNTESTKVPIEQKPKFDVDGEYIEFEEAPLTQHDGKKD